MKDDLLMFLVVEQARAGEAHHHAQAVRRLNDLIVADGAAGLRHIGHAAAVRPQDVVSEGEERVRAQRNAGKARDPFLLFLPPVFPVPEA